MTAKTFEVCTICSSLSGMLINYVYCRSTERIIKKQFRCSECSGVFKEVDLDKQEGGDHDKIN